MNGLRLPSIRCCRKRLNWRAASHVCLAGVDFFSSPSGVTRYHTPRSMRYRPPFTCMAMRATSSSQMAKAISRLARPGLVDDISGDLGGLQIEIDSQFRLAHRVVVPVLRHGWGDLHIFSP